MHDLVLFLVGIIVGAMNAIAGGGMLIGFPILLAGGMSAISATATSALIVLPGQLSSAFGYRKYLRKVPGRFALLIAPSVIGGAIGAGFLRNTPAGHFQEIVPVLILIAVILFAFQPFVQAQIRKHLRATRSLSGKKQSLAMLVTATFILSIYGGFFGPGFGFIMLALLSFAKLHEVHQINAMKNVMAMCIAGASVLTLTGSGLIDWRAGLAMAAGNVIGGYTGAVSIQKISSHGLRILVLVIGVGTTIYLALRSY